MPSPEGLDAALAERLGELSDLRHAGQVLAWDQQVMMPPDGGAAPSPEDTPPADEAVRVQEPR